MEKLNPQCTTKHQAIGPAQHFHSLYEKGLRQRNIDNLIRTSLLVMNFLVQNQFILRDDFFEDVENIITWPIESD